MKVPSTQPIQFQTGDLLAPTDVNSVTRYAQSCLVDVASKRWQHSALVIQMTGGPSVAYTDATPAHIVTFKFICPVTCIIERAILTAVMVSSAAVDVNITATSGGATPSGATVPWLSTYGPTAVTDEVSDTNPDRVYLSAGTSYTIAVTTAAPETFTLRRFDIQLHCLVDRFTPAVANLQPDYTPVILLESDTPNAALITTSNLVPLAAEVSRLASGLLAPTPALYTCMSFDSATDFDLRIFAVPRFNSSRAQCRAVQLYLRAEMLTVGGGGQTVTAALRDGSGATVSSAVASVSGVDGGSGASGTISVALSAAVSPAVSAGDYSILFSTSAAVTVARATCLMWVSR